MFKYFKTKILLQQRIQSIVVLTLCFYLSLIYPIVTKAQQSNKIPISSSIRQLQDPEQRLEAIQILMNLGRLAVPDLIKALQDNNAQVRTQLPNLALINSYIQKLDGYGEEYNKAIETLVNIGKPAIPALVQALRSGNVRQMGAAAIIIAKIGETEPSLAIAIFTNALRNNKHEIRFGGAMGLGFMEQKAAPAVPILISLHLYVVHKMKPYDVLYQDDLKEILHLLMTRWVIQMNVVSHLCLWQFNI